MSERIYKYPIFIRLFLCYIPCSVVIITATLFLITVAYTASSRNIFLPTFLLFIVPLCLAILLCVYGIINNGSFRVHDSYFYHSISKTPYDKIRFLKEITIQNNRRVLFIVTKRLNPFFMCIVISDLINDYEELKQEVKEQVKSTR